MLNRIADNLTGVEVASLISAVCGGILNLFENTARDVFNILDF